MQSGLKDLAVWERLIDDRQAMGTGPQDDEANNQIGQGLHRGPSAETRHTQSNDSAVFSIYRMCEKDPCGHNSPKARNNQ